MRVSEWIDLAFFTFFIALACVRPLDRPRRLKAVVTGAGAISALVLAQSLRMLLAPLPVSVIRDWLPAPVLLLAYWQAGQFFTHPNDGFQHRLLQLDKALFDVVGRYRWDDEILTWTKIYFEFAYLLCYPLVPMGLGVLYIAHMGRYSDEFWIVVLPPTYLCYSMLPFIQTLPPRMLPGEQSLQQPPTKLRAVNLWIVRHASIQVNTFSSAHVATSVAVSLELLRRVPLAGAIFLWFAVSIAGGAVAGRYHYTADVLLAAASAVAWYLFARGALF